ncbi:MAG: ATPase [Candidatus Altiarchaeales archaeon]|nr:ATPase [Candidatus Altiarchaeales archaeon]
MEKVKTGVKGLDEMLGGGFIKNRPYLIAGGPGIGKTILCVQFLMQGVEEGEGGLYIALEEQTEQLKEDMRVFEWDIDKIHIVETMQDVGSGTWTLSTSGIVSSPKFNLKNLMESLRDTINKHKPQRMVIDSLTSIKMLYDNKTDARREILGFMNFLLASGCTTLLTSEQLGEEILMEEFLSSGVVRLNAIENQGERITGVSIVKMRGSGFDKHMRPMKITDDGIQIFPNESVFSP